MNKIQKISVFVALIVASFFALSSAYAMDDLDLSVGLKTLPLLDNKLFGNVPLAIIYNPRLAKLAGRGQQPVQNDNRRLSGSGRVEAFRSDGIGERFVEIISAKVGIVTKGSCTADRGRGNGKSRKS